MEGATPGPARCLPPCPLLALCDSSTPSSLLSLLPTAHLSQHPSPPPPLPPLPPSLSPFLSAPPFAPSSQGTGPQSAAPEERGVDACLQGRRKGTGGRKGREGKGKEKATTRAVTGLNDPAFLPHGHNCSPIPPSLPPSLPSSWPHQDQGPRAGCTSQASVGEPAGSGRGGT
jgi:hypothetical protein